MSFSSGFHDAFKRVFKKFYPISLRGRCNPCNPIVKTVSRGINTLYSVYAVELPKLFRRTLSLTLRALYVYMHVCVKHYPIIFYV